MHFFTPFALQIFFSSDLWIGWVHLRTQTHVLGDRAAGTLVLHFTQDLLVFEAVELVVLWVVARVVELCVCGHLRIYTLCLDLEEERVRSLV